MKRTILLLLLFVMCSVCTYVSYAEPVRILGIGNSFTVDALEQHFQPLLTAEGEDAMFLFVPAGYYWADCIIVVFFGLSIGVLICFLGGLMAVDIAPAEAAGATAGVIGMASYAAAGLQDIVSGYLIEGKKVMVDVMEDGVIKQVAQYDFSSIRLFWLAAGAVSLALLIYIFIHAKRHPQPQQA